MDCPLYHILRFLFKPLFLLLYRPKIIGRENIPIEESLIIASNHKHAMDPLMIILATKRTIHYLAKIELFKGPLKLFFNAVGTLPVDRKNRNPDTVSKAEEMLKNGGAIGIFPEGTRNKTNDDLLPFKKGAVVFAKNTDSKIVPVYIKDDYKLFRKSVKVIIGKPYKVKGNIEDEIEVLKAKMLELKEMRF